MEWLRKHQLTCSRALFRTFEELRKVRRDLGDDLPAHEPAEEPPAPGPVADVAPAPRADREAVAARRRHRPAARCEVVEPDLSRRRARSRSESRRSTTAMPRP